MSNREIIFLKIKNKKKRNAVKLLVNYRYIIDTVIVRATERALQQDNKKTPTPHPTIHYFRIISVCPFSVSLCLSARPETEARPSGGSEVNPRTSHDNT